MEDIPSSMDWLHPKEKEVLSGFKFPKKRNDWMLGRWTAKQSVTTFLKAGEVKLNLADIEIRSNSDGAPEVFSKGNHLPVNISLSHSNGMGLCTVTHPEIRLGCDMEKVGERSQNFIQDYFTPTEVRLTNSLDPGKLPIWATLIWSAKESALKALKKGLKLDTRAVEVKFSSNYDNTNWQDLKVSVIHNGLEFSGRWKCHQGFVLTIVSDHKGLALTQAK